ncbi:MAG: hypothetical protein ABSE87_00735 [Terracidiphilus sp.]
MKRLFAIALVFAFSCCLHAQVVDTTVCDILKNPQSFNGKIVRIKGTVVAGFDQFVVKGADCGLSVNKNIWLAYPEGTKAKAGPAVTVEVQPAHNFAGAVATAQRTPVELDKKSKDFKQFDSLLASPFKKGGMCLGCNRYTVTATLVGRLDGVANAALRLDSAGKIVGFGGFGYLNAYSARLVLQSVSDVASQEVDYSKVLAITKDETVQDSGAADQVAAGHLAAKAFGATTPSGTQLERAISVFGKPNEQNGVTIGFGPANEATAKSEGKGTTDSPDGLLFNCTFNKDRLPGDALGRALAHVGEDIANVRTPLPGTAGAGLYDLENRAWVTTILSTIAARQKTLTLPGGYLIWSSAWPQAESNQKLGDAIAGFLGTEELLHQ